MIFLSLIFISKSISKKLLIKINARDKEPKTGNAETAGVFIAELPRARRARSGAPWVRKFGKLSIPENLIMT